MTTLKSASPWSTGYAFLLTFSVLCTLCSADTAEKPLSAETGTAAVMLLDGAVSLIGKDDKKIRDLKVGDAISPGSRLRTRAKARAALQFPDGSRARFDEFTTVELEALSVDEASGRRQITVHVLAGSVWIHVPNAYKEKRGVVLISPSALVEADKSTYRVTVHPDTSTLVKVYRGLVFIHGRTGAGSTPLIKKTPPVSPSDTGGRVAPSRRWYHYVKPMYQIFVRSNGTPTSPFRFMTKPDKSEWVNWNRQLDEEAGNTDGRNGPKK